MSTVASVAVILIFFGLFGVGLHFLVGDLASRNSSSSTIPAYLISQRTTSSTDTTSSQSTTIATTTTSSDPSTQISSADSGSPSSTVQETSITLVTSASSSSLTSSTTILPSTSTDSSSSLSTSTSSSASAPTGTFSSISFNFNGAAIPASDYIWFSCILAMGQTPITPLAIVFTAQTIQFTDPETLINYSLSVPDSIVNFTLSVTSATTTFVNGEWVTEVPLSANDGNIFLSGLAFQVTGAGGLSPNIHNVVWSGYFSSTPPAFVLSWKWSAAVYTTFISNNDYSGIGVKPIDAPTGSVYVNNNDHAGTPENFIPYVIAGATGNGGKDYTGGLSPPANVVTTSSSTSSILALIESLLLEVVPLSFCLFLSPTRKAQRPRLHWEKFSF